jgi:hypothetical protein
MLILPILANYHLHVTIPLGSSTSIPYSVAHERIRGSSSPVRGRSSGHRCPGDYTKQDNRGDPRGTQLLRLNPTRTENFPEEPGAESAFASAEDSDEPTGLIKRILDSANLERRTEFTDSTYNSFGPYGYAKSIAISQGLAYPHKVRGKPQASADPSRSRRVSCSYGLGSLLV